LICLTFDTDWMTEESLARFLAEFPFPGQGTFFCHQPFDCLRGQGHELAPHPFIHDLTAWQGPLAELTAAASPGARGVRAHSCVFSHAVAVGLNRMGFEYVSQAAEIKRDGIRPFRHPWGIWELPIYYMDNMDMWVDANWANVGHEAFSTRWIEKAVHGPDLYVMDFHPIHVALNSRTADDYQRVKDRIITDGVSPFDLASPGRGAREYFLELCGLMRDAGVESVGCGAALDRWATATGQTSS
jgi:hypothetical protein